jgi:TolB-like protein/class 3 adenylate cyclase/tetratricopeptide (TPR) repeat protein
MSEKGFKRKLTAILSADVVGYSRLMDDDEEATIRTLTTYRQILTSIIQQYRGKVVDTTGDNLLAEFASAVDAVNGAVEIQRELSEKNTELSYERRMEFRIGINVGDVVEEQDRIYGDGVNIAARVEGLADAKGICISGRVFDQVENKLDFMYEYMGEQEVKNIAKPVRVYRVLSRPGAAAHRVVKAKKAAGKSWRNFAIILVGILIVTTAVLLGWNFYKRYVPSTTESSTEQQIVLELPDKPSIAVLPFDNMGGDLEEEYFSDGMTDDLITDLSKVSGLFVIARNSVFTYKGKPVNVQQVAQELGVRYVLEGSVRRSGDQVRINAQLIDATTGHHLWAERYDGYFGDVFALQDRITGKIVAALSVKLTSDEKEQVARKYTDNTSAYDEFLQGRAHYVRRTPGDYAEAVSCFEKAVELDPNYGEAYAALSLTYWESAHNLWTYNLGVSWVEAGNRAERYLEMAMHNPSPLAYQAASRLHIDSQQHELAIAQAQRALALDPNDANSYLAIAYAVIYAGRPQEALNFIEKAMRLNPHYPDYYMYILGLAHFHLDQYEEAVILFEKAVKLNPVNYVPLIPLSAAQAQLGREQEAAATLDKLQKALPAIVTIALVKRGSLYSYKNSADRDRLLAGLRKAGMLESPYDALRRKD